MMSTWATGSVLQIATRLGDETFVFGGAIARWAWEGARMDFSFIIGGIGSRIAGKATVAETLADHRGAKRDMKAVEAFVLDPEWI